MNMKKGLTSCVSLPEDLVMEIFSRLPVHTLLRFKCASKSCCNMITSPEFVKLHLSRSLDRNSGIILLHSASFLASFDFHHLQPPVVQLHHPDFIRSPKSEFPCIVPPVKIAGISNGVVCFSKPNEFVLYNPATRTSKQVPKPQVSVVHIYANEFGYDCIADDYKILSDVALFDLRVMDSRYGTETYLYSLKSNSWQKIDNPPWGDKVDSWSPSVVANNSFYWISNNKVISSDNSKNEVITSFDLGSQRYGMVPLSPEVDSFSGRMRLGVLKGRVHAMKIGFGIGIWMLKEDNEWTLLFRYLALDPFNIYWPLPFAYSKEGNKILVEFEIFTRTFVCCDLNSQTTTTVDVLGLPECARFTGVPWVESLVTLG